jgi:hypothetical protein
MTSQHATSELGVRAATQRGETGDKIPGFDPAAAPMETDAEAGGSAQDGVAAAATAPIFRPSGTSTGSAMRPMQGQPFSGSRRGWFLTTVLIGLLAIVLVVSISAWIL